MSTAALFERIAPRYDELWTDTPIGRAQRNAVWRVVDELFHAGDHVLDLGCGTGEDAAHMASRGITVCAVDASPAMVKKARARGVEAVVGRAEDLRGAGMTVDGGADAHVRGLDSERQRDGGVPRGPGGPPHLTSAENPALGKTRMFDGALSNFGVLNCVEDLGAVARSLATIVRPGGLVAICTIGRFCAWEMLSQKRALRRLGGRAGDVRYPTVRQLTRAFAPEFELLSWTGIGMLVPPSYVNLPARIVRLFERIDRVSPLRFCADHRLLVFQRK